MVVGGSYPRDQVRASHIIKHCTDGNSLSLFGLPPDIDHNRNGLLLLVPIEKAFDRKDICFLRTTNPEQLIVKVLNPSLMAMKMKDKENKTTYRKTYGSINNRHLQLPDNKFPYRRLLCMHAKFAYSRALRKGWIQDDDSTFETYFNISDHGLDEPLGLGNLSWKEVHGRTHDLI